MEDRSPKRRRGTRPGPYEPTLLIQMRDTHGKWRVLFNGYAGEFFTLNAIMKLLMQHYAPLLRRGPK